MAFLKFSRDKRGYENFYLVEPAKKGTKALAEDHMIVHYHQADWRHSSTGIRA